LVLHYNFEELHDDKFIIDQAVLNDGVLNEIKIEERDIQIPHVILPHRRDGKFFCLPHETEGLINVGGIDKWAKGETTAANERRYVLKMQQGEIDYKKEIPPHDLLCGGFPCQPFSIAGVSKKNSLGRKHGFQDKEQGNLFFEIMKIVSIHRPKIIFLENVKNLIGHNQGNTWKVIQESLTSKGYVVKYEIINAASWVPQNRKRVFIVALSKSYFDVDLIDKFEFPPIASAGPSLKSILHRNPPDPKYMLSDALWSYLRNYARIQKAKGNGFGYKLFGGDDVAATMSARYYKDGAEILIHQPEWKNPRKLTPKEAAKLLGFNSRYAKYQGYSREFPIIVSDVQAYKQFGNAVCPPVVESIAKENPGLFTGSSKGIQLSRYKSASNKLCLTILDS
jgi:DNA (cytosine-5)-methyltransferase 1